MRGKMSESEKTFAIKLYTNHNFTVEDLAQEFNRSTNFMRTVVGLPPVEEDKPKRTGFTVGYDTITCELDRGEIKFYLPKDLSREDAELVIDEIARRYQLTADVWEGSEEVIEIESAYNPPTFKDRVAMMQQIIEEEAAEAETEVEVA